MLYNFKKGKNATETQKTVCAVYEEGAVTSNMSRWLVKVRGTAGLWAK